MSVMWDSSAFDPETINALAAALDRACRLAAAEAREQYDPDSARGILAERITEMAKHGERDRARLALGALCHLRQTQQINASKERANAYVPYPRQSKVSANACTPLAPQAEGPEDKAQNLIMAKERAGALVGLKSQIRS